jgi:hypothetical protein
MKKILLSAALLITVCISANAQFTFGIKGGVDYSSINNYDLNHSNVAGYQAGVFARLGTGLYFQPELYLSSSGGQFNSSNNDYSGSVRFTNLNLPLLIGQSFGTKNFNFRIMGGVVFTSVLSQNESFSQAFNDTYNNFGKYNSSTVGYQLGAGVDIGAITADLRYEGGLSDINSNYGQKQNIWALSVGFKIL